MVQTIVTAAILYIATAVDLLVILLIFLQEQRLEKNIGYLYRSIFRIDYPHISQFIFSFCVKLCSREMDIRFIRFDPHLLRYKSCYL